MVNYKKIVLKGNCKEECPSGQKNHFSLCFNKVFIEFEAFHFWPSEGSLNGKLQKDSPQRQLQRGVPKWPEIHFSLCFDKVFIDFEAFQFWPSEGSQNGKLQKDSPQRRLQREVPKWPKNHFSLLF